MSDTSLPFTAGSADLAGSTELKQTLDALVELAWEPGWAPLFLQRLVSICETLRKQGDVAWADAVAQLRAHPVRRLIHEDPVSALTYVTAGRDPCRLLDLLDHHPAAAPLLQGSSRAGMDLMAAVSELGFFAAQRGIPRYLARIVDTVADQKNGAEILTLSAGYLREAGYVTQEKRIARWVAQDASREALQVLRHDLHARLPLRTLHCGLPHFARRPYQRGAFDLITLASLPEDQPAHRLRELVEASFDALKPGGLLLLGSPAAAPPEAALLEALMRLTPRWRGPEEISGLLAGLPAAKVARRRIVTDGQGRRIYALVSRVG